MADSFVEELFNFDPELAIERLLQPERFRFERELWAVALTSWMMFPLGDSPTLTVVFMYAAELLATAESRARKNAQLGEELDAICAVMKTSEYLGLYQNAYGGLETILSIPSRQELRSKIFRHFLEKTLPVYLISAKLHQAKPITEIIKDYRKQFKTAKFVWELWSEYKLQAPFIYAAWSPLADPHTLPTPLPLKKKVGKRALKDIFSAPEEAGARPFFRLLPKRHCLFRPAPWVLKRVIMRARVAQEQVFSSLFAAKDIVRIPSYFKPEAIPVPIESGVLGSSLP